MANDSLVVGLFVGGRGSRMGNMPKGNLRAPDSELSLVERLVSEVRAAVPEAELVLVGNADAYAALGLAVVDDSPANVGPLGGLAGLLKHAEGRGARWALALACDLPRLDRALIGRLAQESAEASVVVVEQQAVRNPLIARYAVSQTARAVARALTEGKRSMQAVLDLLEPGLASLTLSADEQQRLEDWDTPEDVQRG